MKKPKIFYGYIVVTAASFIMAVTWGTMYNFGLFFKPIIADFGWTRAETSWAYSLAFLLYGLSSIISGRLTDRFGPKRIAMTCGILVGSGYLIMSQIQTIWQLYTCYGVLIGISMGGLFVPLISTVSRWFVKRRGLMIGIVSSSIGFGVIIMPPMASHLILNYGWRHAYIIFGVLLLVVTVVATQLLRTDPRQMGLLPDGEITTNLENLALEAKSFSLREAVYTKQFLMLFVTYLSYGIYLNGVMVHIVPHAIDIGISAVSAAGILSVIGGLTITGRLLLGGASDRIGKKPANIISFVLLAIALVWLTKANELQAFFVFAALFGLGYGGIGALISPVLAELFGIRAHGAILGVSVFAFALGSTIGPVMIGKIFDVTNSYQDAFMILVALGILSIILASLVRPVNKVNVVQDSDAL